MSITRYQAKLLQRPSTRAKASKATLLTSHMPFQNKLDKVIFHKRYLQFEKRTTKFKAAAQPKGRKQLCDL